MKKNQNQVESFQEVSSLSKDEILVGKTMQIKRNVKIVYIFYLFNKVELYIDFLNAINFYFFLMHSIYICHNSIVENLLILYYIYI